MGQEEGRALAPFVRRDKAFPLPHPCYNRLVPTRFPGLVQHELLG